MPDKVNNFKPIAKPNQYFNRVGAVGIPYRTSVPEITKELGKYDVNLRPEINQEANRGFFQPAGVQWMNGFVSRGLSIGTKVGEGLGYAIGAVDGLINWDASKIWDNSIAKLFSNMDEGLKEALPVYNTRQYLDGNLLSKMGTVSFWANDAFDGVAFMLSAYAPGGIAKNLSSAAKGVKAGKAIADTLKAERAAEKSMKAIQGGTTIYNTISESGFEAKDAFDSAYKAYKERGLSDPEAKRLAGESAARTFRANMAVLWAPNYIQSKWFHPSMESSLKELKQAARYDDKAKELMAKFSTKKAALEGLASEGLWEENVQTAIQQYESEFTQGLIEEDFLGGVAANMLNNAKGFAKAFTPFAAAGKTKEDEGAMAIFLGGLLGGLGSVRGNRAEAASTAAALSIEKDNWKAIQAAYAMSEKLFQDTNKYVSDNQDEQTYQKHMIKAYAGKTLIEQSMLAIMNNNPAMYEYTRGLGAAAAAWEMKNIQGLEEGDLEHLLSNTQDKELIKEYMGVFDQSSLEATSKLSFSNDPKDALLDNFITRTSFFINSKIKSLEKLRNDKNGEQIDNLIEDQKKIKESLLRKDSIVQKRFKQSITAYTDLMEKLKNETDPKEKAKLEYLAQELQGIDVSNNNLGLYSTHFNQINPLVGQTPLNELQKLYSTKIRTEMTNENLKGKDFYEGLEYAKTNPESIDADSFTILSQKAPSKGDLEQEAAIQKSKVDLLESIKIDVTASEVPYLTEEQEAQLGIDVTDLNQIEQKLQQEKALYNEIAGKLSTINNSLKDLTDLQQITQKNTDRNAKINNQIKNNSLKETAVFNFVESFLTPEASLIDNYLSDKEGFFVGKGVIADAQGKVLGLKEIFENRDDISDKLREKVLKKLNKMLSILEEMDKAIDAASLNREQIQKLTISNRIAKLKAVLAIVDSGVTLPSTLEELEVLVDKELGKKVDLEETRRRRVKLSNQLREVLKELLPRRSFTVSAMSGDNPQFAENPDRYIFSILSLIFNKEMTITSQEITPFRRYKITADLNELLFNLEREKFKSLDRDMLTVFNTLINYYNQVSGLRYLENLVESKVKSGAIAKAMLDNKSNKLPTIQQRLAIFDAVRSMSQKAITVVKGIYGSGKTQIVAGQVLKILFKQDKTSIKDVYSIGHSEASSEVISKALGTTTKNAQSFLTEDVSAFKYLVIDEAYAFENEVMEEIIKKAKKAGLKVLAMGDPSQVTTSPFPAIAALKHLDFRDANPITVVMRTAIRPIASLASIFQYNPFKVNNILNEMSEDISNLSKGTLGSYSGTRQEMQAAINKDTGRTKLVIVNSEADRTKYSNPFGKVVTYDKAQGLEADEVYVDMDPSGLDMFGDVFSNKPPMEFNSAMAMSISRAKQFVFTIPNSFMPQNKVNEALVEDANLYSEELERNAVQHKEALARYLEDYVPSEDTKEEKIPITQEEEIKQEEPEVVVDEEDEKSPVERKPEEDSGLPTEDIPLTVEPGTGEYFLGYPIDDYLSRLTSDKLHIIHTRVAGKNYTIAYSESDGALLPVAVLSAEDMANFNIPMSNKALDINNIKDPLSARELSNSVRTIYIKKKSSLFYDYDGPRIMAGLKDLLSKFYRSFFQFKGEAVKPEKGWYNEDGTLNWNYLKDRVALRTFTETAAKKLRESGRPFNATIKLGVPYLIIHNPKTTEDQQDVPDQFIRLEPPSLTNDSKGIKYLNTLVTNFEDLSSLLGKDPEKFWNSEEFVTLLSEYAKLYKPTDTYGVELVDAVEYNKFINKLGATENIETPLKNVFESIYGVQNEDQVVTVEEFNVMKAADPSLEFNLHKGGIRGTVLVTTEDNRIKTKKVKKIIVNAGTASRAFNKIGKTNSRILGDSIRVSKRVQDDENYGLDQTIVATKALFNAKESEKAKYPLFRNYLRYIVNTYKDAYKENPTSFSQSDLDAVYEMEELINNGSLSEMRTRVEFFVEAGIIPGLNTEELLKKEQELSNIKIKFSQLRDLVTNPNAYRTTLKHTKDGVEYEGTVLDLSNEDHREIVSTKFTTHLQTIIPTTILASASQNPISSAIIDEAIDEAENELEKEQKAEIIAKLIRNTPELTVEELSKNSYQELLDMYVLLEEDDSTYNEQGTVFSTTSKGKLISKEEAARRIKKLLPGIEIGDNDATTQLKFFEKILNAARIGVDTIWGRVSNAVIGLKTEGDKVYDQVMRHEVFHMAYKYLLSRRSQKVLHKSLSKAYGINFNMEEALAELYQVHETTKEYKKGVLFFAKKFINDLAILFNISNDYKWALDRYFNYIDSGIYDSKIVDNGATPSNFDFVRHNFKSVRSFRLAKHKIMLRLAENNEKGKNGLPLTRDESVNEIYSSIASLRNTSLKLKTQLENIIEKQEEAGKPAGTLTKKLNKVIDDFDTYNTLLLLNPSTKKPLYFDIIQDFYSSKLSVELVAEEDMETRLQALEEESQGIRKETQDASTIDYESKISNSIKDFLSFIPQIDPVEFIRNGVSTTINKFISPRFAFIKFLQIFQEIDINQISSMPQQLAEYQNKHSINAESKAVINHLSKLVNESLMDIPTELEFTSTTKDLSLTPTYHLTIPSGHTYSSTSIIDLQKQSGVNSEVLSALYKRHEAQNTIKELQNILGSMKESEYYILKYTRLGGSFSYNYIKGTSLGVNASIKSYVIQKIVDFAISDQFLDPKTQIAFKNLPKALRSKNNKEVIAAVKELMSPSMLNMSSLFDKSRKTTLLSDARDIAELIEQFKNIKKYDTIEDWVDDNSSRISSLTGMLADASNLIKNPSIVGTKGKMYIYHATNYIHQTLANLKEFRFAKDRNKPTWRALPEHLEHEFYSRNPFIAGENVIHSLPEHDAINNTFGYIAPYLRMNKLQFIQTHFLGAFVSMAGSRGKVLKYIQYLYQQSDKPRPSGATINVLKHHEIKKQLANIIEQQKTMPSLEGHIKKYKDNTFVNLDILSGLDMSLPTEELVEQAYEVLTEGSRDLVRQMIAGKVAMPDNLSAAIFKDYVDPSTKEDWGFPVDSKTKKVQNFKYTQEGDQVYMLTEEHLMPLVDLFFKNYYINSFFLNQIIAGSSQFYGDGKTQVKRMSGPSAPGHSPLVGRFGSKSKFKVGIVGDKSTSLSSVVDKLSIMLHNNRYENLEEEQKQEIDDLKRFFSASGFDVTDAQGFVSQKRFADLQKGFGRGFKLSTVMKPVYFGIDMREIPRETDNGIVYEKVPVPTYLKYSSIVLTDVLVNRFPSLGILAARMENNGLDELIFTSGNKVGIPANIPTIQEFENGTQVTPLELSNTNFKIQLNPRSKSDSSVALPTQLIYFHNVVGTNDAEADSIFNSLAAIYNHGLEVFKQKSKNLGTFVRNAFEGGRDAALADLINAGVSINNPLLEKKAIISLASGLEKETSRVKFDGAKFILQTAYGTDSYRYLGIRRTEPLKYYINDKGQLTAQCIVPSGFLPRNLESLIMSGKKIKSDNPLFVGFRIPSTELHSAIAVEVVGIYDAKGTNVIIAPDLLVALHGSDHDGDSLSVLKPSVSKKAVTLFNKDTLMNALELVREIELLYNSMINSGDKLVDSQVLTELYESVKGFTEDLSKDKTLKELNELTPEEVSFLQQLANEKYEALNEGKENPISKDVFAKSIGLVWNKKIQAFQVGDQVGYAFLKLYGKLDFYKGNTVKNLDYMFKLIGKFKNVKPTVNFVNKDEMIGYDSNLKFSNAQLSKIEQAIKDTNEQLIEYQNIKAVSKALEKQLNELNKLAQMWHKNNILNSMSSTITAEKNRTRMSTPISMESWNGKDEKGEFLPETVFKALQEAGLLKDNNIDLSDFRDAFDAYKSVSDGGILTGVFANNIKVLAYIIRSGGTPEVADVIKYATIVKKLDSVKESPKFIEKYKEAVKEYNAAVAKLNSSISEADLTPHIHEDLAFDYIVDGEEVAFNKINQQEVGSVKRIWDTLDSFVNVAIDNVKEQILPTINANTTNGNAYIAMLGLGFPLVDAVLMMVNPAVMHLNTFDRLNLNNIEKVQNELDARYKKLSKGKEISIKVLSRKDISNSHSFETQELEEIETMYNVLEIFKKMYTLGESMRDLSSFLNIIRVMPVTVEDMDKVHSGLAGIGKVFSSEEGALLRTTPKFGFRIPLFFQKNPHIQSIYGVFQYLTDLVNENFYVHSKTFRKFISDLDLNLKLDGNPAKNKALLRREVAKYLMSSLVYPRIKDTKYKYANKKGIDIDLAGSAAYSQQFCDLLMQLKDLEEDRLSDDVTYEGNLFVQNLAVEGTRGRRSVRFTNASNSTPDDVYDFQRSFELLNKYEVVDGKLEFDESRVGISNFQKMFVDYAAINFGFGFSSANYGFALPSEMFVGLSTQFDQLLKKFSTSLDYRNLILEHVKINLVVQNSEYLPDYIKYKKQKIEPEYAGSENTPAVSAIIDADDNGEGGREIFFDVAYANPYYKKSDVSKEVKAKLEEGTANSEESELEDEQLEGVNEDAAEQFFPEFVTSYQKVGRSKRVKVIYRRINNPYSPKVYYQKLGSKNTSGFTGWDRETPYTISKYLDPVNKRLIVNDNSKDTFEYSLDLKDYVGEEVLLVNKSDVTAQDARLVKIVEKGKEKNGYTSYHVEDVIEPIHLDNLETKDLGYKAQSKISALSNILNIQPGFATNSRDVLNKLLKLNISPETRAGLTKLKNLKSVPVNISDVLYDTTKGKLRGGAAANSGIAMPLNQSLDSFAKSFLHELIHMYTIPLIQKKNKTPQEKQAVEKLEAIYEYAKTKSEGEYGFTSLLEFVAETYSNPTFRKKLSKIPIFSFFRSVLGEIAKALANLFGIKVNILQSMLYLEQDLITDKYTADGNHYIVNRSLAAAGYVTTLEDYLNAQGTLIETTEDIEKAKKKINLFISSEDMKESGDNYIYKNSILARVSDTVNGGVSWFRKNITPVKEAEEIANNEWGKTPKTDALPTTFGKLTHAEYVKILEANFEKGKTKGNIIHALIEKLVTGKEIDLSVLYADSGYTSEKFEWVNKKIKQIIRHAGINIYDKNVPIDKKDKLYFEQLVASEILGLGGRADLIAVHNDGSRSYYDFKTGTKFNAAYMGNVFKYGNQGTGSEILWDNAENRAKLQVMLYALIDKLENPDIQINNLSVLWLPYESSVNSPDFRKDVQIQPFLNMIRDFLNTEKPEVIERIRTEKGQDVLNKLFDSREYKKGYDPTTAKSLETSKMSHLTTLERKMAELRHAVMYDVQETNLGNEHRRKAAALTKEILDLRAASTDLDLKGWTADLSMMSEWIGTNSSVSNPFIQMYDTFLVKQKSIARARYASKYNQFLSRMLPVYNDYIQREGKSAIKTLTRNHLVNVDSWKLYGWMYKGVHNQSGELIRYELNHTKEDWDKAKKEYSYITDDYIKFATWVADSYEEFFVNKGKKVALANQIATYIPGPNGFQKALTNLDVYNGKLSFGKRKISFEYKKGFFPKIPKDLSEFSSFGVKAKEWWTRFSSYHLEDTYANESHIDTAIPMKYLGSSLIDSDPNKFSFNVERQFDLFNRQMIFKEELDDAYSLGKGVQHYLEFEKQGMPRAASYLKTAVETQVRNRNQRSTKPEFNAKNSSRIDWLKILSSSKSLAVAPIMWFNWVGGVANGVFGFAYTHKEGLKNSILASNKGPFKGLDTNHVDFTEKDLVEAHKDWLNMTTDSMQGKIHENKTFLLLKRLNYLPDNYDWATRQSDLLTTSNKLFSQNTPYVFYSLPEEALATIIMVAQLKSMKISNTHPEESVRGKSLWDMYETVEMTDKDGFKYIDIQWKQINGKPVVRGLINVSKNATPEYQEITELQPDEIRRMYYVYEKLHGGYRKDEATKFEYYVIGSLFTQLRRYLPAILRNALQSSGKRSALGYFKIIDKDATGQEVMEWHSRVMEGRWLVLGKSLQTMLGLRFKFQNPTNQFQEFWNNFVPDANENYTWDKLDVGQKEGIVDAMLTLTFMFAMIGGYVLLFGGNFDDDDSVAKLYRRIIGDFSQQYNLIEISKNLANTSPIVLKKNYDILKSISTVMMSSFMLAAGDEDAFTNEGNLRGWTQLQRDLPFLSAYRKTAYFWENLDEDWQLSIQRSIGN